MTPVIGSSSVNAASAANGSSSMSTCSGPYADDEMQSGESTPSAVVFDSRSWCRRALVSGGPRSRHLIR